jgi:hypothetical protein
MFGPIGRIEPALTKSGSWLSGALTEFELPPLAVAPVQKSYQVPAGK